MMVMLYVKNSHCAYCGNYYGHLDWPRTCPNCRRISYLNPLPVALLLLPVDDGLLLIRRSDSATYGKLAIPGGFIDAGETWQQAAVREAYEEANIQVDMAAVTHYCTESTPNGVHVCVFGIVPPMTAAQLPPFINNQEVLERVVVTSPVKAAFDLHTNIIQHYFAKTQT